MCLAMWSRACPRRQELDKLVNLLELTPEMTRMFTRAVELLRENGGRVAAPVMKGDHVRISALTEKAWGDLSDQEKSAATKIGFSETLWATFGNLGDSTPMCRPTTRFWSELNPDEKVCSHCHPSSVP